MSSLNEATLHRILDQAQTIALVGHSPKPQRPSYQIAQYLRAVGYQVYPIHPAAKEIDGHRVYASLEDLPGPVDIVNVFRRAEFLPEIVEAAIAIQAPMVWAQVGVTHPAVAAIAAAAQLNLMMDRCIKIEHQRLLG